MRPTHSLQTLMLVLAIALVPVSGLADSHEEPYGPHQGDWEFLLSATGSNNNNFNAGAFGVAASLGFFLFDSLEAGARHNMTFLDASTINATFLATTRGFLDFHIDLGAFQPFLGANLGVRYGNGVVETTGTFAPELGIKIFAIENAFILAMAEYQVFFDEVSDAGNQIDDGQFVYTVGIGFLF